MPPSTREESMVSNSTEWSQRNNKNDAMKILRGKPTRISPLPPDAAVVDMLVDDDNRPPQPSDTAPNSNRLQEWSAFQTDFDEFLRGFAKFRKERGLPDERPSTCSDDDDDAERKEITWGTPEFRRVIGKLEQVNRDCSKLLDRLEQSAPSIDHSNAISTPQQPVRITQLPCVDVIEPPATQPPAPTIPELPTPQLGEPTSDLRSSPATIHNVTHVVESDRPFAKLPPPAPDPVDMVCTGTLWPQPRPACKLIPVKKKILTKPTIVRRRDQDLRPP